MAQCAYCQAQTELFDGGSPICVKCSEMREAKHKPGKDIRTILVNDIVEATAKVSAANKAFSGIMDQFPSGLPHPDGTQRIKNASRELDAARTEMMKAHTRLNDFIQHGVVPEDLKQNSNGY
jgi:hypothetical protein